MRVRVRVKVMAGGIVVVPNETVRKGVRPRKPPNTDLNTLSPSLAYEANPAQAP